MRLPTMRDVLAIGLYGVTAMGTLRMVRLLHARGVPAWQTRKLVHVLAGISPLVTMRLARQRWAALLPPALTIPFNLLRWQRGGSAGLDRGAGVAGTLYLPLAQLLLLARYWQPASPDSRWRVEAALLPLALGDAVAAVVGRRVGRHHFWLWGERRSVEGSAAMALLSFIVLWPLLWFNDAQRAGAMVRAIQGALVATLAEAATPRGLDNLSIPLAVSCWLARPAAPRRSRAGNTDVADGSP